MKIAINGALGRMGRMVLEAAGSMEGVEVACLLDGPDHPESGGTLATPWGDMAVKTSPSDLPAHGIDAGIDFSLPEMAVEFVQACAGQGVPVVSGTTGLSEAQFESLRDAAEKVPVLWAPNTSLGVFCLHEISETARRVLGSDYDVEIMEIHHRHKRDAPSGTALSLARLLSDDDTTLVRQRDGETGPRKDGDLGILAVRGGEVAGEHTVMFLGANDRLEITHRAGSRRIFAEGGLVLARQLVGRDPGLFTVRDILGR